MTSKELAKELIERIPESNMYYILAFLQGAAIPDEATNRETLEAIEELESGKGECFEGSTKDFFANMYVIDGIAYAGNPKPMLKVVAVRALTDWKLWLKFNDDSIKIYDFKKMLDYPAFKPLKDIELFNTCYVDFGTVEWGDGKIDIGVEELYNNGVDVK